MSKNWVKMPEGIFDVEAPAVQGSLFAEPDPFGTPDLFSGVSDDD